MNNNTKEMFERARNGDKEVRKQLIENNIGIAISIAIKYTRSETIDIETAKQEATIGLIKSVDTFEPDKYDKIAFTTYAYNLINWQIIKFIREKRENLPYKLHREDYQLKKQILEATPKLINELHKFPTQKEIAKYLEADEKDIEKILQLMNYAELDRPSPVDEETDKKDIIPDHNNISEEQIINKIIIKQAIQKLPAELREIIELKYFRGYYLKEISKIMNIPNHKLYRSETKALEMLAKELKGKEIDKPIKKRKYDKEDLEKRREKISVLMKQGLKQKQIADLLGVAQNTISREKKKIMGN